MTEMHLTVHPFNKVYCKAMKERNEEGRCVCNLERIRSLVPRYSHGTTVIEKKPVRKAISRSNSRTRLCTPK